MQLASCASGLLIILSQFVSPLAARPLSFRSHAPVKAVATSRPASARLVRPQRMPRSPLTAFAMKKPEGPTKSKSKSGSRSLIARSTASGGSPGNLVVVPEDYRFGGTLLFVAFLLGPGLHLWWPQFFLHALLGGFLTFQTTRVRFRFSDKDLDVVFTDKEEGSAESLGTETSGENYLQGGGENKWSFDSITNWEMWWPGFPLLVYFKETQTKSEGQPHFFPIIMDGKKLYEQMLLKMGPSKNPKPSLEEWNLDTALESTEIGRKIKQELSPETLSKLKDVKDAKDVLKLIQDSF